MEDVLKDVQNEAQDSMSQTIKLTQESWAKVVDLGLQEVGEMFFKNIFTIAPEAL